MAEFLDLKDNFFNIYDTCPHDNIKVLDINVSCLIQILMGSDECYVMNIL